jgi:hypothetical protein
LGEEALDLAKSKKKPKKNNLGGDERTLRVAALRDAERCGNDAPWKAWKTQKSKSEFSTLSTGLGNPAKTKSAGFPHFHRAGGGLSHSQRTKYEVETKFQLTDHGHFKHDSNASVASLRP